MRKRMEAILTRDVGIGGGGDQLTGVFQSEADALVWAVNAVGYFNAVRSIDREDNIRDHLIGYSFHDQNDKEVGYLTLT